KAASGTATVTTRLPAGEAVAWVGGGGTPGQFRFKVEAAPPPAVPLGDTCATAQPLVPVATTGDLQQAVLEILCQTQKPILRPPKTDHFISKMQKN
ncbi:MAG: hypothetical protein WCJ26_10360, partial [bacterium]